MPQNGFSLYCLKMLPNVVTDFDQPNRVPDYNFVNFKTSWWLDKIFGNSIDKYCLSFELTMPYDKQYRITPLLQIISHNILGEAQLCLHILITAYFLWRANGNNNYA